MQGLFFCWHTSTQSGASSSPENSGVAEPKEGGQVSCDTAHDLRSTCSYITQEAAPQPGQPGRTPWPPEVTSTVDAEPNGPEHLCGRYLGRCVKTQCVKVGAL